MKTGDMLQWKSNSLIGSLIRWRTARNLPDGWPAVNHTGMVIQLREYGRIFTQESLEHGVVLNFLSRRLEQFDGEAWWYPLKDEMEGRRNDIGKKALDSVGIPYDYGSIVKQIIGKVSVDARDLFCSEDYLYCFGYQGKALSPAEMPELGIFKEPAKIL